MQQDGTVKEGDETRRLEIGGQRTDDRLQMTASKLRGQISEV